MVVKNEGSAHVQIEESIYNLLQTEGKGDWQDRAHLGRHLPVTLSIMLKTVGLKEVKGTQ